MTHFDYEVAKKLHADDVPFYALIMAAMMKADSRNQQMFAIAFPDTYVELYSRYEAPAGWLPSDVGCPPEALAIYAEQSTRGTSDQAAEDTTASPGGI